jgi:alpha-methylacyl-CoA racemase
MMSGPLTSLRVVEFSGIGPGPLVGQLLADLGADVVTVDRRSAKADPADVNRRNKRSVALNLRKAEGLAAVRCMLASADVLIEGFRPGVMERLGLGPDVCLSTNPRLVYGRVTGWGQTGPLAHTAGHDINYLGITGALHAIGRPDEPPVPPLNLVADFGGGSMFLAFGILAALFERAKSGHGQVVDAAMVDGVPAMMGLLHGMMARGLWSEQRGRNLLDGGAPFYRTYRTADGKYICVGAIEPEFFAELVHRTGLPEGQIEIQNDPDQWPDMHARYAEVFRLRTRDEWTALFEGSDACAGPVLSFTEAALHPHNTARGTFFRQDGVLQAAPAPRFGRTPAASPRPPGAPGADTHTVLMESGATDEEFRQWQAAGALT